LPNLIIISLLSGETRVTKTTNNNGAKMIPSDVDALPLGRLFVTSHLPLRAIPHQVLLRTAFVTALDGGVRRIISGGPLGRTVARNVTHFVAAEALHVVSIPLPLRAISSQVLLRAALVAALLLLVGAVSGNVSSSVTVVTLAASRSALSAGAVSTQMILRAALVAALTSRVRVTARLLGAISGDVSKLVTIVTLGVSRTSLSLRAIPSQMILGSTVTADLLASGAVGTFS